MVRSEELRRRKILSLLPLPRDAGGKGGLAETPRPTRCVNIFFGKIIGQRWVGGKGDPPYLVALTTCGKKRWIGTRSLSSKLIQLQNRIRTCVGKVSGSGPTSAELHERAKSQEENTLASHPLLMLSITQPISPNPTPPDLASSYGIMPACE